MAVALQRTSMAGCSVVLASYLTWTENTTAPGNGVGHWLGRQRIG